MVTDRQFRRLRKLLQTEATLANAADRAEVDEKTARKYRDSDLLPSQRRVPHTWRTREDPFQDVWPELARDAPAQPGAPGQDPLPRPATPLSRSVPRRPAPLPATSDQTVACPRRAAQGGLLRPGPRAGTARRERLHLHGQARRHHPRPAVRPHGLSLRAHLLQLGGRHRLLLRELREPQRGPAERLVGTGRSPPATPHRSLDRGGQQRPRIRDVHSTLPGIARALRARRPGDPAAAGQREWRRRAESSPLQAGRRPGPDAPRQPRFRRPRRLSVVPQEAHGRTQCQSKGAFP